MPLARDILCGAQKGQLLLACKRLEALHRADYCLRANSFDFGRSTMGVINVIDTGGQKHELEAVEGWRVMEIIREHGLPMEGTCGGACACATCHVVVDDKWNSKLHPARDDEEDMLDNVPNVMPGSRLCCQLIYSEDLDGLTVTLDPALEKQARAA
jgi:2Fe-2S ferredoxin